MTNFLIKFAITLITGLAGILTGLHLGAGLSSYFFTYEQGVPFMLEAIPWAVAGLSRQGRS